MALKKFWLMKTEPESFSIKDLKKKEIEHWDGIRNYQSRNFIRDDMRVGDRVLVYHSNANPPGVAGLAEICRAAYPDFTAWDPESPYFDPKSDPENPRWFMVDVRFVEEFPETVSLEDLKQTPELEGMMVIRKGMRLSIQPVEKPHFEKVVQLGRKKRK
jgi:predicted RNA-binding protein with PUA-like domain